MGLNAEAHLVRSFYLAGRRDEAAAAVPGALAP
jgi:hypothetical protein